MKKIITLTLFTLGIISCMPCENSQPNPGQIKAERYGMNVEERKPTSIFVRVESHYSYYVVYDRETLVMYTVSNVVHNEGNFTLLVNADGTPRLYKK